MTSRASATATDAGVERARRAVRAGDADARLGPRERAVLAALLRHGGRVVDRDQLRRDAGLDELSPRRCEAMLVGIRRVLGPEAIVNVRGRGWRLHRDVMPMARAITSVDPG